MPNTLSALWIFLPGVAVSFAVSMLTRPLSVVSPTTLAAEAAAP
jgi:hypothetical protein